MVPKHVGPAEFPAPRNDDTRTYRYLTGERPFHISIVDVLQIPTNIAPVITSSAGDGTVR